MAGHYTAISQDIGHLNYLAVGTFTQPSDDNVDVHIHCGFKPKAVIVSADPLGAAVAIALHTMHMAAGDSTSLIDGTDLATGVTLRDNWQVTTAEYYIRDGSSVQSSADTDDYITGFSLGTEVNGTDSDVVYWVALG